MKSNVFICPPCGESVALATKEGQNKEYALWPLLPRLTAVLPPQGREMSFGFTLIELLVVVLIIGILAAIAVPQYQKAVKKTYLAEWATYLNGYMKAIDVWTLQNGYPDVVTEFTGTSADPRIHADLDLDFVCDPVTDQPPNQCQTKVGGFHAGCEGNHCWANIGASYHDFKLLKTGEYINVNRRREESAWMLDGIISSDTDTLRLICQYWKEHYGVNRMREDALAACAAVGVE